jgi:hypothetical protein
MFHETLLRCGCLIQLVTANLFLSATRLAGRKVRFGTYKAAWFVRIRTYINLSARRKINGLRGPRARVFFVFFLIPVWL